MFDGSQTDCYGCVIAVTIDGHVLIEEHSSLTLLGTIHNLAPSRSILPAAQPRTW